MTYIGAEVLERVTLNSVDAELGAGLNSCETARHYAALVSVIFRATVNTAATNEVFRQFLALSTVVGRRTEELLAATGLLDDLNKTRLQLLNGGNVTSEDTHLSGLGGNVDLDAVGGSLVQGSPKAQKLVSRS